MPKTWSKSDLVDAIAEKADVSRKDAAAVMDAAIGTITCALQNRDKVQLTGFGTFEARARKERKAKNLHTGEDIIVPATTVPAFKAGKALKDAVKAGA